MRNSVLILDFLNGLSLLSGSYVFSFVLKLKFTPYLLAVLKTPTRKMREKSLE